MPTSVIAAVIVASATSITAGVAGGVLFGITFTTVAGFASASAIATFAISSGLKMVLGGVFGGGSKRQSQAPITQSAQDRQQVVRSPVAVRQIVYGQVQMSGALLYAESTSDNNELHMIIACAGHEVQSISDFYINDKAVGSLNGDGTPTGGKFANNVKFVSHHGASDQVADPDLISAGLGWNSSDRLRGVAYVYVVLTYSSDIFPTGIPNIKFTVTGKKLFDPRTSTTAYSNNSALCAYDYLVNHFKASTSSIDSASFIAAANICDESVTLLNGGVESRYTCNGMILTDTIHKAAIDQILSSCGGNIVITQGKYHMNVAAYTAPVLELDETFLRGGIKVIPTVSKKVLYNGITATYVNPNNYWQASDMPVIKNSLYATQDGEEILNDIQLPMTTSSTMAQRIAKILLEKSRQAISVQMPCNLKALQLNPFDNITLSIDYLGWSSKVFKVISIDLQQNGAVDLTLQEEASGVYDWSAEETSYDLAPNTNLPDPFSISPPGNVQMTEEIYETTGSAGVKSKAILTWSAPNDSFIIDYEVEYKLASSGTWLEIFNIRGNRYEFFDLTPDVYNFRVKSRNILGVVSEYTQSKTFEVIGLTAPPTDIQRFSVSVFNGLAKARWDLTTDLDVRIGGSVDLRHAAASGSVTWEAGTILDIVTGDSTMALLPLIQGTYMAKFVDSTGHYSDNEATFFVSEDLIAGWNVVATITESPDFTGSKSNVFLDGINLELTGSLLFDDIPDFDLVDSLDYAGGIASSGTYTFTSTTDLGSSATRRFHVNLTTDAYSAVDIIDSRTSNIDTWSSFDNLNGKINDCNVRVDASVSQDDITYTSWTPFMVADFNCRYAKFRAILTSGDPTHNIHLSKLEVAVKTPV